MNSTIKTSPLDTTRPCAGVAKTLNGEKRQELALKVLRQTEPVSDLSRSNQVSRKFLYHQAEKAKQAINEAFDNAEETEGEVLFYLPVTKQWIRQLVLGLVLIGYSSYRGVVELLRDLFDYPISIGTVYNILQQSIDEVKAVHEQEDLSPVKIGAHDEIFQAGKPVLAGVDAYSTYCYLLTLEDSRDADTWAIRLLELQDQGLYPTHTIADGGKGIRAGQAEAWPLVPCFGDVFHALLELGRLVTYLENRAKGAICSVEKLERKMEKVRKKGKGNKLSKKLGDARAVEKTSVNLNHDIAILYQWMQQDILALVGHDLQTREELFDFVVEELRQREPLLPHRISPVRKALENQRDDLLTFVADIDLKLENVANEFNVPVYLVRKVYEMNKLDDTDFRKWQIADQLKKKLSYLFHPISEALNEIINNTVRASSVVENFNSRLRNYFFLRRQLGPQYLELLRFFLNHRRFIRSDIPERKGKSPSEVLSGKPHKHWLEMLGFQRFQRAA